MAYTENKNVHSGAEVANWISQINAGGTVYDIATHHGITFKNGAADTTGVTWNGITELEVVIPTIADIVTTPVEFAGTVGADGSITWATGFGADAKKGNLVFITADCTFAEKACEAGDMAVFDGTKWNVVSGENQVEIKSVGENNIADVVLTATAKEVLEVEGKHLKLSVDFTGVADVLEVVTTKNAKKTLSVANGTVAIDEKHIVLEKADDSTVAIGQTVEKNFATSLANGNVTISQKVLTSSDFTLTDTTFPAANLNSSTIAVSTSTSIAINKKSGSDFVSGIAGGAVSSVGFTNATYGAADLNMVTAISAVDGDKTFVNGIHAAETDAEKNGTADLVIPGTASITGTKTFVSGLSGAAESGDLVSSITVGAVTVSTDGEDIIRGLGTEATGASKEVITNVTIGSASHSNDQWFYSGLGNEVTSGWNVITSVSVGNVSLTEDSTGGADAFVSATVSDHVLSFGTAKFQTPVKVSQADTTIKGRTFTKTGVSLTGFEVKSADLLKGSISQAATAISYKTPLTGSFNLDTPTTKYYFDKAAETTISYETAGKSLDVKNAVISTSSYELINTGVTANIPANKVVVSLTDGVAPTLNISNPSGTISGVVDTALSTETASWIALNNANLTVAGAYTLKEVEEGGIAVAVADTYNVDGATVTIAADTFMTDVDVKVSGTALSKI